MSVCIPNAWPGAHSCESESMCWKLNLTRL